ncbi:MAG: hypothetical protein Q4G03_06965 [Planctomycetia bacterium]|nr:hypothetical protein [Planctomycetia bacterium]
MFIGPVFTREATIAPRRDKTYLTRGVYGAFLLLIISAAWLVASGSQHLVDVGDLARFGSSLFALLAPVQMAVALFLGALFAAAAVGQEKDRKTLLLLLLTRMSNSELALGKLCAALLEILLLLVASCPIFLALAMLGGVSNSQVARVVCTTLLATFASGSLGSCIALWRDKTFQALSATILALAIWLGFWEAVGYGALGTSWFGVSTETIANAFSPWRAILLAQKPDDFGAVSGAFLALKLTFAPIMPFICVSAAAIVLINGFAIMMCRVWNPSRETIKNATMEQDTWRQEAIQARLDREAAERRAQISGQRDDNPYTELADNLFAVEETLEDVETREGVAGVAAVAREVLSQKSGMTTEASIEQGVAPEGKYAIDPNVSSVGKAKEVWDNPILWREVRTRAYGRKTFIVGLIYFVLFALAIYSLNHTLATIATPTFAQIALPTAPLFLLSMFLLNAQAIASMTSERDLGAFPLLLASDLSPKEFVFGKLLGTFYNMKEATIFPLLLCGYLGWRGVLAQSTAWYLFFGMITLYFFVAMIGVHIGLQYENTRNAAATSLGVVFFLFIGVAVCIWTMVAFSGSFEAQLQPFLAFMLGGGVGLYVALGARNPSKALALASFALPPATFYAATSFMLGKPFLVFISVVVAYFFAGLAMLIPAIDEFDVATGRATAD